MNDTPRKIDDALRLRIAIQSARAWGRLGRSPDMAPFEPDDAGKSFHLTAARVAWPGAVMPSPIDPSDWLGIPSARIRVLLKASGIESKSATARFWATLAKVDSVLIGNFAPSPADGRYWFDPSLTEYARWPFMAIASPSAGTFHFHLPVAAVPERDLFGIDLRFNAARAWLVMPL